MNIKSEANARMMEKIQRVLVLVGYRMWDKEKLKLTHPFDLEKEAIDFYIQHNYRPGLNTEANQFYYLVNLAFANICEAIHEGMKDE